MSERAAAWDVIVVGSGAAGLAAACTAASLGGRVLLLEQASVVGGTTAISGGMLWLPGNAKAAAVGRPDSVEAARAYLAQLVTGTDRARLDAFLDNAAGAMEYLEQHTSLQLQPVPIYPDYYPDLPGAALGGRVLQPQPYDGAQLGDTFRLLRSPLPEFTLFGGMMIGREDIPHLRGFYRSPRSFLRVARLVARFAGQRARSHRGTTLHLGNALAGRLLYSALQLGVEVRVRSTVRKLVLRDGSVAGVDVNDGEGRTETFTARRGVILATGGISHTPELRRRCVPAAAGEVTATVGTVAAPSGALLAGSAGAPLPAPTENGGFWVPASLFRRSDGTQGVFPHTVTDRGKPGVIAVDQDGRRFTNEAVSYHEFVRAQFKAEAACRGTWLICDRRFLWRYGLGKVKPFALRLGPVIKEGYLYRAGTLAALARALDIDAATLEATMEEYNRHARQGTDPLFGRGGNAYQRHMGDAQQHPNPCVAPIERAPFYAVRLVPADLGMAAGLATDAEARVLDAAGRPIQGLYACGNDMHSVMEGAYPGPGITLGPALTFGWIAARHAMRACPVADSSNSDVAAAVDG